MVIEDAASAQFFRSSDASEANRDTSGNGSSRQEFREGGGGGGQKTGEGKSCGVNCEITHSKAVKLENENIQSSRLCTHTVIIWHRRTSEQCLVPIIIRIISRFLYRCGK